MGWWQRRTRSTKRTSTRAPRQACWHVASGSLQKALAMARLACFWAPRGDRRRSPRRGRGDWGRGWRCGRRAHLADLDSSRNSGRRAAARERSETASRAAAHPRQAFGLAGAHATLHGADACASLRLSLHGRYEVGVDAGGGRGKGYCTRWADGSASPALPNRHLRRAGLGVLQGGPAVA